MQSFLLRFRRFILKQRIELLCADIACMQERHQMATICADSARVSLDVAHRKLRSLRANLAMIERPDVLLAEALQGPHE